MLAGIVAVFCLLPLLLVLASFVGLAPYDFNMLLVAIPVAGIGIILAVVARSAVNDLLLPQPVLVIDEDGLFDRRLAPEPIRWSDVAAATVLLRGRGGVVLELRSPIGTGLDPFRPGTFMFERPEPGVAHVPVRAMTQPPAVLATAILEHAEAAGAVVGSAATHEKMRRRSWIV